MRGAVVATALAVLGAVGCAGDEVVVAARYGGGVASDVVHCRIFVDKQVRADQRATGPNAETVCRYRLGAKT